LIADKDKSNISHGDIQVSKSLSAVGDLYVTNNISRAAVSRAAV